MEINKVYEAKKAISSIKACKNNELYDSMIYWSQKAFNICDILIKYFSKKNDIVFDPFLGSGVTLFQSIKKNAKRNAIGCEINEPPIFIIKTILKKYNLREVKKQLDLFSNKLDSLNHYYEIICPNCGSKAIIKKTLFDFQNGLIKIKECDVSCKCNMHKINSSMKEELLQKINIDVTLKHINDIELIPNSRIAVKPGQHISSIFTNRNLMVLDEILGIREEFSEIKELIDYLLLSIIHLCKITDTHSNSQWPLWIPKTNCVEKNIIIILKKRIEKLKNTLIFMSKEYSNSKESDIQSFTHNNYHIFNKGIQNITNEDIPDNSIDLVITDPPYLGQVEYSEYMQLYKPFFDFDINLEDEIVVSTSPSRNKTIDNYFMLLKEAFKIIGKKTKEGAYLCLYFHDSSLKVWDKLISILNESSFYYISQIHINKTNTVKNNLSPKKSLNGDAILFFIKDPENLKSVKKKTDIESLNEIEQTVISIAKKMIQDKGKVSTTELYDEGIMEVLIQNGWLSTLCSKYDSLVDLFEKFLLWDKDNNVWFNPKNN